MKKIAIAFTALLAVSQLNAGTITQSNENPTVSAINNDVVKRGTVIEVTENGGRLMDNQTGIIRDFVMPAPRLILVGDRGIYIDVSNPSEMKNGVVKFYNEAKL